MESKFCAAWVRLWGNKNKGPVPQGKGPSFCCCGAGEMNRTPDLLITNELLYRLSYTGVAFDYSVVAFGSFRMVPGAEFAKRDFQPIKRTGGLVLILSSRSRRSAN